MNNKTIFGMIALVAILGVSSAETFEDRLAAVRTEMDNAVVTVTTSIDASTAKADAAREAMYSGAGVVVDNVMGSAAKADAARDGMYDQAGVVIGNIAASEAKGQAVSADLQAQADAFKGQYDGFINWDAGNPTPLPVDFGYWTSAKDFLAFMPPVSDPAADIREWANAYTPPANDPAAGIRAWSQDMTSQMQAYKIGSGPFPEPLKLNAYR